MIFDLQYGLNNTDAILDWTVASEINSSRFDIERSINGNYWTKINSVAAAGNGPLGWHYTFMDKKVFDSNEPGEATFYYRLKMVDLSGYFEYSNVRQVSFESRGGLFVGNPFPNPAGMRSTSVQLPVSAMTETDIRIDIYDIQSRIVISNASLLSRGNNKISIGTSTLSTGVYHIKLTMENGGTFVRRLVVL